MESIYLGIVIFLFALAIFDLIVGCSNDAVNFLNSAIGAKAASFKLIITVAAIGVFCGASMSNGMMDIARHGMFNPQHFYFGEIMFIFLAVIVTDVVLLDTFNSLGMPTSTTVSMVFELLGASTAMAVIKIVSSDIDLSLGDLLNTEKALSVILGIFVSVAIAFFFGTLVQWITRLIFTFKFKRNLKWKIGIFGGIAVTSISYFMLIKGIGGLSFMTPEKKLWVEENTATLMTATFVISTVVMQILHAVGVNVLKIIVLFGTFSLAMAFAGNDLVNFIGVSLAGYSSYQYYIEAGAPGPMNYTMERLNEPASTSVFFLVTAGIIMVIALATSKKAHNVVKTSVDLTRQDGGDEMFGSSKAARRIVRSANNIGNWVVNVTPPKLRHWIDGRFDSLESDKEEGAAFDLIRATVNLVLAGLLVALGTSLKLPLSTTYVTFMVAMGSALADRAWSRESAVFRITGVLSVIGGWLITAAAAFLVSGIIVSIMKFGGLVAAVILVVGAICLLIHSNISFSRKQNAPESKGDALYHSMLDSRDKSETWNYLRQFIAYSQTEFMQYITKAYAEVTEGFTTEDIHRLRKANNSLPKEKSLLKSIRRKQTLGMRRIEPRQAIENNTWLHLSYNNSQQMVYCCMRMCEPCLEHIDNNFAPLPDNLKEQFAPLRTRILDLLNRSQQAIESGVYEDTIALRNDGDVLKNEISTMRKDLVNHIHEDMDAYSVIYVYLNMLQESQELISSLRHMLRAIRKLEKGD